MGPAIKIFEHRTGEGKAGKHQVNGCPFEEKHFRLRTFGQNALAMTPETSSNILLAFIKKIFSYQDGALFIMAFPGAVGLPGLLDILIKDTPLKSLILPLVVAGVGLSFYLVIFILDFISGVKASKHEAMDKENYFQSRKGWNSVFKITTVATLVIWSGFFSMVAALTNISYLPNLFMIISAAVSIMASLLDIYSIGENQKRLTGKKARFFEWMESMTSLISEGFTSRLRKFFEM